ncbi:MAG: DUF1707 SHOCT-like domain-containing protein [Jatrophihabitans sp.]
MAQGDSEVRSSRDGLRIGNAERDRAAELLGEHFRAGRLDVVEYDERVSAAYAAYTDADLLPLFTDLPKPTTANAGRPGVREMSRPLRERHRRTPLGWRLLQLAGLAALGLLAVTLVIAAIPFVIVGLVIRHKVTGGRHSRRWDYARGYRSWA